MRGKKSGSDFFTILLCTPQGNFETASLGICTLERLETYVDKIYSKLSFEGVVRL